MNINYILCIKRYIRYMSIYVSICIWTIGPGFLRGFYLDLVDFWFGVSCSVCRNGDAFLCFTCIFARFLPAFFQLLTLPFFISLLMMAPGRNVE